MRRGMGQQGFTVIELLLVVIIIGILSAIAIPNFLASRQKSSLTAVKADVKNISTAIWAYHSDQGLFPSNLTGLSPDYMKAVPAMPDSNGNYRYCVDNAAGDFEANTDGKTFGPASGQTEVYVDEGAGVREGSPSNPGVCTTTY